MAAGGNAADGAIAAALALGVVNPSASGFGGGGFALVYTAKDGSVTALDFRETAPATFSADVLWPKRSTKPGESRRSRGEVTGVRGGVVGVSGEPAGLELLSRTHLLRHLGCGPLAQRSAWTLDSRPRFVSLRTEDSHAEE
jgi:gamma-glutamyltranspeptidase/glutathione hydrolase